MTDLQKEFEATGYTSWINADLYPDGKIYTQEYTEWLEKQVQALRMEHEKLNNQETAQLGMGTVISSTYHQGINDSIKTIESILDYKSNTKWGSALRFAVNQIESLKKENMRKNNVSGSVSKEDKSLINGSGLFFFKSRLDDKKKLEIAKWYKNLSDEHREFVDIIRSEAIDETDFFSQGN